MRECECVRLNGWFEIKHIRNGEVIDERVIKNTITNAGKAAVAGLILTDVGGTAFDYIGIGTDDGTLLAVDATNTALGAELDYVTYTSEGARTAGTGTQVTTTVTNDTAQLQVTYNFIAATTITESGVFNAATGGTMLCRQTFAAINVASGDSLQITWKVQVS